MEVVFNIPHLFHPGVPPSENAEGLRVLLDTLIALDMYFLRNHAARPLYASGVVYARTDDWETIPALYADSYHGTDKPMSNHPVRYGKFGDCKSLTAAFVAENRLRGNPCFPEFRFSAMGGGENLFHILVRTPRGFEDPSARLGMGKDELRWFGL